jgi:hypothetical protein
LSVPIVGVVSDGQDSIRKAVKLDFPTNGGRPDKGVSSP